MATKRSVSIETAPNLADVPFSMAQSSHSPALKETIACVVLIVRRKLAP